MKRYYEITFIIDDVNNYLLGDIEEKVGENLTKLFTYSEVYVDKAKVISPLKIVAGPFSAYENELDNIIEEMLIKISEFLGISPSLIDYRIKEVKL